jgi:1A family penicillin-binding protein
MTSIARWRQKFTNTGRTIARKCVALIRWFREHPWKTASALFALGFVVFITCFFIIDRRVAARLAGQGADKSSVVYADSVEIVARSSFNKKALLSHLSRRRYFEVEKLPDKPGEYSIKDGFLHVVTRPFQTARGKEVPSITARLHLEEGSLLITEHPGTRSFFLEPVVIAPFGGGPLEARTYRTLDEIPKIIADAVLATEDQRFYYHFGIDPLGILRAVASNIKAGKLVEGGSTLTQQLAKNILLSPKKTLSRKIQEAFAALSLELRLSKDEILEKYLNEVYFAQSGSTAIHGVGEATHVFFGKNLSDITLAEAALLAGMVQAPSAYSPRRHPSRAKKRRDIVLSKMRSGDVITKDEYETALKEPIKLAQSKNRTRTAPFFVAAVENSLAEDEGIQAAPYSGVDVYTGLDIELQTCAEQAIEKNLARLEKGYPSLARKRSGNKRLEQALVAIETYSGEIKAWVGGRDFSTNQFDHIAMGKRQIGSTIKPFLYLTALDGSLNDYKVASPVSILSDEPTRITIFGNKGWTPQNYDHKYRGDVTLRYALEKSLNVPAVYVAQRVGIPALVRTLSLFHLAEEIPHVPALALGALDTTLLRLTAAYSALSNGGVFIKPKLYKTALEQNKSILAQTSQQEERLVGEGSAFVLTDMLRGVVERGTAHGVRRLGFEHPAAGKTGTSDNNRDAWFVGYTPNLAIGVWTGFDDNSKTGLTGGQASAPVWAEFMKCAEPFIPQLDFIQPPSVTSVKVDTRCNGIATKSTPRDVQVSELFVRGSEPQEPCVEQTPVKQPFLDYRNDMPRRRRGLWDRLFG